MNPGSQAYYHSVPNAAIVAVLGDASRTHSFEARTQQVLGRELTLQAQETVPSGTQLQITVDGGVVLGSVSRCSSDGNGHTLIVAIDEVIPDAAGLTKLVSAVMELGSPAGDATKAAEPTLDDPAIAPAVLRRHSS